MLAAKELYERWAVERAPYLDRAEESAKFTIPALMPPAYSTSAASRSHDKLYQPYQSLGARGVNSLSANLLMSLLPPTQSFFRLVVEESAKADIGDPAIVTEIEKNLSQIEQIVSREIEIQAYRPPIHEALRLLIVTGNALVHIGDDGTMRTFRMDNYVIKRGPSGKPVKIILKEKVHIDALDPEVANIVRHEATSDKMVELYTCVMYDHSTKKYNVYQHIEKYLLPDSEVTYKEDELPYIALRFTRVDGEDYGRSFVEEHIGDIRSLEGLSQAILEGAVASAKVLFLVSPNGTTKAKALAQSSNGAIVQGSANDVSVLQVQKHADMSVALSTIAEIKERLGKAFMITSDLFRQAERVTATEIQAIIRQVEKTLGGLYSLLSSEFQLPLIKMLLKNLQKRKEIPKLPKEVHPTIIVGVDAIGRAAELEKLDTLLAGMGQLFGPEALGQYVNVNEYISRRATALGVQVEGLIKTQEELQQEQQQAMMQQAMMQGMQRGGQQPQTPQGA
tara:strand:- start:174 stop:1694 length:1521 start_codon:yes stop_codon:yes gene_type:complete